MRFEPNNKYFTIAIYVILTYIAILLLSLTIFHFNDLWKTFFRFLGNLCRLFKPLIIGGIIAYLLDPVVEFYEKRCQKAQTNRALRTLPTALAIISLLSLLGLLVLVITMNVRQVLGLSNMYNISLSISKYMSYFENMFTQITNFTRNVPFLANSEDFIGIIYNHINLFVGSLWQKIFSTMTVLGANILNIALALVIAFYLLQDKKRVLHFIRRICTTLFSPNLSKKLNTIRQDIDHVFSNYIRGQLIDALIVGLLACLSLTLIRIDFAIIIGIIAGIFNLIPYFGPVVGFVLAGLIGLMDANPNKALYAVLALVIIQQIDGWVIVPKVVGNSVKLHPIIVLLAILVGGKLFGLIGMLLGVPIAGFIRVLILRYMQDDFETT